MQCITPRIPSLLWIHLKSFQTRFTDFYLYISKDIKQVETTLYLIWKQRPLSVWQNFGTGHQTSESFKAVIKLVKGRRWLFLILAYSCTSVRGCQIGMQGPQFSAKPRYFCKLDLATSRMAFLDLNLYVLQVATSNSNNWGHSVVQNCTSDTP